MKMTESSAVRHLQQGFSLIELLIALALGLAVLVGFSSVFVVVKQSFRFQETTGRLQEDGTFALDSIAKDLRMAGYAGCAGIHQTVVSGTTTYYPGSLLDSVNPNGITGVNPLYTAASATNDIPQPFTPYNFIRGFDNVPTEMFATGLAPSTGSTHSLFFAKGSYKAVSLKTAMTDGSSNLPFDSDTYKWANKTYDLIVSDCTKSRIFKGKVTVTAGLGNIDHSQASGNSTGTFGSDGIFGTDAIVMPAEWSFYYVATRTGAGTPSLYRVSFNGNTRGAPEEMVSNVERLQLNYGENTNALNLAADVWRTCAAGPATTTCDPVTDWSRVVAVRIGLMMISSEENANSGVTMEAPTLLGQAYNIPAGASTHRLRKEFSTTVALRNRVAAR